MSAGRRIAAAWLAFACMTGHIQVHAQTDANRAVAQSLFDQGRALMNEGKYSEACPKFAESYRLDRGGGTLVNLAVCYEKDGKTASAWATFKDVIAQARQENRPDREQFARDLSETLFPKLSYLTVNVSPKADVDGLVLTLDGHMIGRAVWGMPMPLDPGVHILEARAPNRAVWRRELRVFEDGDRQTTEVADLGGEVAPSASASGGISRPTAAIGSSSTASSGPLEADKMPHGSSSKKTIGYVVGGTGLVALGIGSYFGLRAASKWSDRNSHCVNGACDAEAVNLADDTHRSGTIANVAFGVGVVGLAVGTYLVLTSPSSAPRPNAATAVPRQTGWLRIEPAMGGTSTGVAVGGAW